MILHIFFVFQQGEFLGIRICLLLLQRSRFTSRQRIWIQREEWRLREDRRIILRNDVTTYHNENNKVLIYWASVIFGITRKVKEMCTWSTRKSHPTSTLRSFQVSPQANFAAKVYWSVIGNHLNTMAGPQPTNALFLLLRTNFLTKDFNYDAAIERTRGFIPRLQKNAAWVI